MSALATCGRFGSCVDLRKADDAIFRKRARIWSVKPKRLAPEAFVSFATDGDRVLYSGEVLPVREFLSSLTSKQRRRLLVLTQRELNLILAVTVEFDAFAIALEVAFPVFDDIKYGGSLDGRLKVLRAKLTLLRKVGVRGRSVTGDSVAVAAYRVERAIRSKNGLDRFFFLAPHAPFQEVYRLREERDGRIVVALDFNSMYGSCMGGMFPDPRSLKYVEFKGEDFDVGNLQIGLYHAIMSGPRGDFIGEYSPFRLNCGGKRFPFSLETGDSVEVLLFENELRFYYAHFESIKIQGAIVSDSGVEHPLSDTAIRLYRERRIARSKGRKVKDGVLKMQVASLHSVTGRKRYRERRFADINEAISAAEEMFQVGFHEGLGLRERVEFLSSLGLMVMRRQEGGVVARFVDNAASDSLHCFSARVVANARLKLVSFIEHLRMFNGLDICYVNADSAHVSIRSEDYSGLLDHLGSFLSDEMGGVRIQCVADRGYWLDVGRYWLMRGDEVVKYANRIFNHPGSSDPFLKSRRVGRVFRGRFVDFVATQYLSMERSFSFSKKVVSGLDVDVMQRYKVAELLGSVAGDAIDHDRAFSEKIKMDLFNRIATGEVSLTRDGSAAVAE